MIFVMGHPDDWNRSTNAKLLAKRIGGPSRLDTAAQVECGNLVAQQAKRPRKLLEQDSDQCGAKCRVVPGAEPRSDPVWRYAEAIGRFNKCVECIAGIFGRVFVARESLLLVIADKPNSPLTGRLHERDPRIMWAPRGDASEINRRTTIKFRAHRAKALRRKRTV